jgi:hypothetical protein
MLRKPLVIGSDQVTNQHTDDILYVPNTLEEFSSMLATIPLQFFSNWQCIYTRAGEPHNRLSHWQSDRTRRLSAC